MLRIVIGALESALENDVFLDIEARVTLLFFLFKFGFTSGDSFAGGGGVGAGGVLASLEEVTGTVGVFLYI